MEKWYLNGWLIFGLIIVGIFTFSFGIGFLLIVGAVVLWALKIVDKKKSHEGQMKLEPSEKQNLIKTNNSEVIPEAPKKTMITIEKEPKKTMNVKRNIGDFRIKYEYENKSIAMVEMASPDYSKFGKFDEIKFELDPTNQHDDKAIKILCNDIFLGYVYKGKEQDMIHDWIKKSQPIYAVVTSIDKENNNIKFYIAFYKNPFENIERFEKIKTKLIKISKKIGDDYNRQDVCQFLERGEQLELEYDDDTETFVAKTEDGEEAGELSKAISKKIMEKFDEHEPICLVEEPIEDDNGKCGADLLIYLK